MIPEILQSYARSLEFLRRLVADVPDELFTAQRSDVVNHPAWVIGHLIHSAQAIGGEMGVAEWVPETWGERFGTGSTPVGQRDAYPSKDTLLEMLADAEGRITTRLPEIGQEALAEPLPDERYRDVFPTIGHAALHILTSHTAIHIGQLTVWRRIMGFGPLSEPFI